jgi:hypothetical protein
MSKTKRNHIKPARVAKLYAKGLSVTSIAERIGASYMGVRLSLIRQGVFNK